MEWISLNVLSLISRTALSSYDECQYGTSHTVSSWIRPRSLQMTSRDMSSRAFMIEYLRFLNAARRRSRLYRMSDLSLVKTTNRTSTRCADIWDFRRADCHSPDVADHGHNDKWWWSLVESHTRQRVSLEHRLLFVDLFPVIAVSMTRILFQLVGRGKVVCQCRRRRRRRGRRRL